MLINKTSSHKVYCIKVYAIYRSHKIQTAQQYM